MTDKIMQISFLPQDIELVKNFLHSKSYSNIIEFNDDLDGVFVNLSKIKDKDDLYLEFIELIINLIEERDLKGYIWNAYPNLSEMDKGSVYSEALILFNNKKSFIKETIYNKINDLLLENKDINLYGFFKFRMKDFASYISIISDIAMEEHLIKRDRHEFLDSLKGFIEIQEEKINLLRITITKDELFILSDEYGNELNNLDNEEMRTLAKQENLSDEDMLISAIMTFCPKKIEILDKLNNYKSKDIIDVISLLFEGKVTIIYSN